MLRKWEEPNKEIYNPNFMEKLKKGAVTYLLFLGTYNSNGNKSGIRNQKWYI